MDMATLAILPYYSISLSWTQVPLKRFFNLHIGASREKKQQASDPHSLHYKTKVSFLQKKYELL